MIQWLKLVIFYLAGVAAVLCTIGLTRCITKKGTKVFGPYEVIGWKSDNQIVLKARDGSVRCVEFTYSSTPRQKDLPLGTCWKIEAKEVGDLNLLDVVRFIPADRAQQR